jgi:hypothetical protein
MMVMVNEWLQGRRWWEAGRGWGWGGEKTGRWVGSATASHPQEFTFECDGRQGASLKIKSDKKHHRGTQTYKSFYLILFW